MALNITGSGATAIGLARAIRITVNLGFTGTLAITAAGSTQYGTNAQTMATITNPATGQTYAYGGLHEQGSISINPSTTTDITVMKVNKLL